MQYGHKTNEWFEKMHQAAIEYSDRYESKMFLILSTAQAIM